MKSKGAIKFFAIALVFVCIYQLSFTYVAYRVESKAKVFAQGDPEKERRYLDSLMRIPVYNLGITKYTYQDVKERELNLGLDLRGGMHVTLEVDLTSLVKELSDKNEDETFNEAIRIAKERQQTNTQDFITLFYEAFQELDPDARLAAIYATPGNQEYVTFNSSNDEIISFLRRESREALRTTFNILRTRIDRFGVAQPNIQMQEGTGRIIVELPGVDDPDRVRRILQGAAELKFFLTYEYFELTTFIQEANEVLSALLALESGRTPVKDNGIIIRDEDDDDISKIFADPEEDTISIEEEPELNNTNETDTDDPFAIFEETDTTKPETALVESRSIDDMTFEEWQTENPLSAILQPAVSRTEEGTFARQGPVIGYSFARDTATVNAYLNKPEVKAIFPQDIKFTWSMQAIQINEMDFYELVALKYSGRDRQAALSGDVISDARSDVGLTGRPEVNMTMNPEGASVWRRITADNIGRSIAIVLDNYVISYPTVQSEIAGGRSQITGQFTIAQTQDLANILRSGRLPLSVNIIQEAIVGPSLGQQSIKQGTTSLLFGIFLVLAFMVFYYNRSGLVANIALLANLFFILGVLSSLGAALTLPGIAGIVLTMGMSVDANVLIFQRIREELREGKGIRMAIADGYKNAYSSIIDANITTLLTGIILFTFGTGPIHGFATILIIGILTSLFSAIFITRLIFEWLLDKEKGVSFDNKITANAFENFNIDFISKRKIFYVISGLIILFGIISISIRGFDLGVDFKGGYSFVVKFDENVTVEEVRSSLTEPFESAPEVKMFGAPDEVKITTSFLIHDDSDEAQRRVEQSLVNGLNALQGPDSFEIRSVMKVGPTIAEDIKTSAIWAVIFSLIIIFLYIFIRFKKWQFGVGAILALFHDVLILLAVFSLFKGVFPFSLEIDQAFIAALLTVVGYSINDSVVVFDRIRETLSFYKKKPLIGVINTALNNVLSRTIVTSLTTLFVISILFFFGGEVIRGFSFALMIGVVVGTYSSIFIATPALIDLQSKQLHEMRAELLTEEDEKKRKKAKAI